MAKRIGNEAKTINLFLSLSDEGKRIVLDVIKSQSTVPRKQPAKKTAKASDESKTTAAAENTGGTCAKSTGEWTCDLPRENPLHHDQTYSDYHAFEAPKVKRAAAQK
jgi:hypothetical protein